MNRNIILSIVILICAIISASGGLFWDDGGSTYFLENVNGETVELFGNGLYATESLFKAPINKGTDAIILFVVVPIFLITTLLLKKDNKKIKLLHLGLVGCFLYYSASISFGVSYNILFLVYIILFSASLFKLIISIVEIDKGKYDEEMISALPHKGLVIYLVLAGMSVFVWLIEIVTSIASRMPPSIIGMNTTEPTFVIDIGIIAPACFLAAILVYKRKQLGYILSVVLLTINSAIGIIVLSQTIFQNMYGVIISIEEFIPYVMVFVIMSIVATTFNIKILRRIN